MIQVSRAETKAHVYFVHVMPRVFTSNCVNIPQWLMEQVQTVIKFVARAWYRIVREEADIIVSQDDVLQRKMWNRSKPVLNI